MADDTSVRSGIDRSRINTSQDHEVRYWAKELGVSPRRSFALRCRRSGPSADKVREYLGGRKNARRSGSRRAVHRHMRMIARPAIQGPRLSRRARSRSSFSASVSRNCRFRILPTGLTGNASTHLQPLGQLEGRDVACLAGTRSARRTPSVAPSRRTTKAQAFSPNTGSGIATSVTALTFGCAKMKSSTSSQLIFSPPRLMRSLRAALGEDVAALAAHDVAHPVEAVGGERLARSSRARCSSRGSCTGRA